MHNYMLGSSTLILASLLAGTSCGEQPGRAAVPTSPPAHEIQLTRIGACGDAFFWASTAEGDIAVTLYIDAANRSTTQPLALTLRLPDSGAKGIGQIILEPRPRLRFGYASGIVRLTGVVAADGTRFAPITMTTVCVDCYAA
jgi:hypothetical protein